MCSVLFEPSPRVNGFPATVTAQFTIAPCEPAYCSTAPGTAFACIPCAPPPGEPEPISPIVWLLVALAGAAVVALIGVIIYMCFCRKDNNKSLFDNIISSEESARVHVNPVSKKAPITSVRSELWTHPRHTNHIQHAERERVQSRSHPRLTTQHLSLVQQIQMREIVATMGTASHAWMIDFSKLVLDKRVAAGGSGVVRCPHTRREFWVLSSHPLRLRRPHQQRAYTNRSLACGCLFHLTGVAWHVLGQHSGAEAGVQRHDGS